MFRDRVRGPVTLGFAAFLAVVLGGGGARARAGRGRAVARRAERRRRSPRIAYVPAVFLARLLPLHERGTSAYWAFLVVVSLGVGAS